METENICERIDAVSLFFVFLPCLTLLSNSKLQYWLIEKQLALNANPI